MLQAAVGLYLSSFVLLSLLKMVMPWRLNWVNNFLQEMSSVLVIGVIVYLLAPYPKLFSRHAFLFFLSFFKKNEHKYLYSFLFSIIIITAGAICSMKSRCRGCTTTFCSG